LMCWCQKSCACQLENKSSLGKVDFMSMANDLFKLFLLRGNQLKLNDVIRKINLTHTYVCD